MSVTEQVLSEHYPSSLLLENTTEPVPGCESPASTGEHQDRAELVLENSAGLPSGPCAVFHPGWSQRQLEATRSLMRMIAIILNIKRIPPGDLLKKCLRLYPAHRDFVLIHLDYSLGFGIVQLFPQVILIFSQE